tara:strand:- start:140 stop:298 length:159 start_codon:yes stop_codon:yes gene_type:complete
MSGYVVSGQVMLGKSVSVFVSVFSNIVTSKEIVAAAGDPTGNNPWNLPEFTT